MIGKWNKGSVRGESGKGRRRELRSRMEGRLGDGRRSREEFRTGKLEYWREGVVGKGR